LCGLVDLSVEKIINHLRDSKTAPLKDEKAKKLHEDGVMVQDGCFRDRNTRQIVIRCGTGKSDVRSNVFT
jgi:hypothetical protein